MNKIAMSKMNRFLMTILIILILIIAGLGLGIYYIKSSENTDWQLPSSSVSGKVIYEMEQSPVKIGDVCREGQRKCFGPGYIECLGEKGSLNWGEVKFCEKNQTCKRGECING